MYLAKNKLFLALPLIFSGLLLGGVVKYFYSFTTPTTYTANSTLTFKTSEYEFEGSVEEAVEVLSLEFEQNLLSEIQEARLFDLSLKALPENAGQNRKLQISVTAQTADIAKELANSFSKQAVRLIKNWQTEKQQEIKNFLQKELETLNKEIASAEKAFFANSKAQAAWSERSSVEEKLELLNIELSKLLAEQEVLRKSISGSRASKSYIENDAIVIALSQEIQAVDEDISKLSETLKPAHPDMQYAVKIKGELEKEQLQRKQHLFAELERDYEVASNKVKAHKSIIEQAKTELSKQSAELAEYKVAEGKLEISKKHFADLSNRLNSLSIDAANSDSMVTIGALASRPAASDTKVTASSLMLASFIGGLIGLICAILLLNVRQRLGSARVTRAYLAEDILAEVPNLKGLREPAVLGYERKNKLLEYKEVAPTTLAPREKDQAVVHLQPYGSNWKQPSPISNETFRDLSMQFVRNKESESMNILVTSSMGGEGKTTVSNNLGRAFARAGYKTLVIDTNLTWPPIDGARVGLAEYLRGDLTLETIIQRSSVEDLYTVNAGVSDPESREMLCSRKMWQLIQIVSETFDYVIFDGPAVLANNDVLILSEVSDQTILVIDSELTDKRQARDALEKLNRNSSNVKGIVLNRTASASELYYKQAIS